MRTVPTAAVTDVLRKADLPQAPIRLFAYVEAIAACGLLILVGTCLFGS
jgi:hypothetical protein